MKHTVNHLIIAALFLVFYSCKDTAGDPVPLSSGTVNPLPDSAFLIVLGTVQDAGSPHIACKKDCCRELFQNPDKTRKVVALGLVDPESKKCYLMEATPDLPEQLAILNTYAPFNEKQLPDGIFITHAHIGHYTGLMYLGKEGVDAGGVPVYTMPGMQSFLERNGPWDQLVTRNNIAIREIAPNKAIKLTPNLQITPFTVPHRDEYSETAGYIISGPDKKVLFIPDIDKWEKWKTPVNEAIASVDYAYIDGTFFDAADINHRDVSQIPHPFITESMALFKTWPASEKSKIRFIHLNHSNPVVNPQSDQTRDVLAAGYGIARIYDRIEL